MYERKLIDYIPHILRNVREYKAIFTDAEEPEITLLWGAVDDALNDQFIPDATENGVSRWEKILNITPKATATLDERKFTILTKINEQLPFTMTRLKEQLSALCGEDGYAITLNHNEYTLTVQLALTAKNNFDDVTDLLNRIVPANMILSVTLKYNQHETLSAHTHEYLSAFTHYQVRNEVLSNGN